MIARQQPSMQPPKPFQIRFCGEKPSKPPLKRLFFNVILRNRSDHPRWFLLPAGLYAEPNGPSAEGLVDVVEVRAVAPPANVKIATFMGSTRLQPESAGGFQALLLPARAVINLSNLQIRFWGETTGLVPVTLVMADQLTVAGVPAAEWLGRDLLTDAHANVEDNAENIIFAKRPAPGETLPVKIQGTEDFSVLNALSISCSPTSQ
jgi:hypothetical protein